MTLLWFDLLPLQYTKLTHALRTFLMYRFLVSTHNLCNFAKESPSYCAICGISQQEILRQEILPVGVTEYSGLRSFFLFFKLALKRLFLIGRDDAKYANSFYINKEVNQKPSLQKSTQIGLKYKQDYLPCLPYSFLRPAYLLWFKRKLTCSTQRHQIAMSLFVIFLSTKWIEDS